MNDRATANEPDDFGRLTFLRSIDIGPTTGRDPRTWTIGGRPLTPRELEIAQSITPEEFEEAASLALDSHQARADMARAVHESLLSVLDPYGYPEVSQLEAVERAPEGVQMRALQTIYRTEGPAEAEQMWRTLQARALAHRMIDKMPADEVLAELQRTAQVAAQAADMTQDEVDQLMTEVRADPDVARQRLVEAVTEGVTPGVPVAESFHRAMRSEPPSPP